MSDSCSACVPNESNMDRLRELTDVMLTPDPADISRVVVELLSDGIVIIDTQVEMVYVSPLLQHLFGYTAAELIGRPVETLVPQELRDGHVDHRDGFMANGSPRRMSEGLILKGRHKDGSLIPVKLSLSPLKWGDNGQRGAVAVVQKTAD